MPAPNPRHALALALLVAGCAATTVATRLTPPAVPAPRAADRVVDLRYPPDGKLVVKFGDGTVGAVPVWSDGGLTTLWRSSLRVRDFDSAPHHVCVLTERGEVGCLFDEAPKPLEVLLRVPDARTLAIARNGEVCVTTASGATRCHVRAVSSEPSVAERIFNALGKLRRIVPRTWCGIDLDGRLMCLAAQRADAFVPGVVLEHVLDASLVANGPYSVSGCVVTERHTVQCWGPNRSGEAGIGRRSWTAPRGAVPGLTSITRISYASGQACALDTEGVVHCWGAHFGPDYVQASARVPRCPTRTETRKIEPCPPRAPGDLSDDPCGRMRWRSRRLGGETDSVTIPIRDPGEQCVAPGEPPYASRPTRITIAESVAGLVARGSQAFFLRRDGVLVSVGRDATYGEHVVSPIPNDPRSRTETPPPSSVNTRKN